MEIALGMTPVCNLSKKKNKQKWAEEIMCKVRIRLNEKLCKCLYFMNTNSNEFYV